MQLLRSNRAYVSLTTIIMCCIDALAAGIGEATRGKFEAYAQNHFPDLCHQLAAACATRNGAKILYDNFRNGFAHLRGPKTRFAIAEEHELPGIWAEKVQVEDRELVAINIDRITNEFLRLL